VFEFVLVFVVVHLLSPEHAACLPAEITLPVQACGAAASQHRKWLHAVPAAARREARTNRVV
jgi:hypothetical protein